MLKIKNVAFYTAYFPFKKVKIFKTNFETTI